jgi:uncharacterized damage-inducible protein DinB
VSPAPIEVLSSQLAAAPAAVWTRVSDSRFVADYLGLQLPATRLGLGCTLVGIDREGRPITLTVTGAAAPASLSMGLLGAAGASRLHLSIAPSPGGSRLTVLHEDAAAAPADRSDPILRRLRADPSPMLLAGRVAGAAAVAAAVRYLADSAASVRMLLDAMAADQGHERPAGGGFSLAEHLWHLADLETLGWVQRFARLRDQERPVLPGIDGDRLAIERRYQGRPWRAAARRFIAERRRTLALLSLADDTLLQRPVVFGGRPSDGAELLAAMLAHDHQHRLEMADCWQALHAPPEHMP